MTPADRITVWLARMRASGQASVSGRSVVALAGVLALVLSASRPWDQLDLVPLLAVPLLVVCLVVPDSWAPLLFLLVVVSGWLLRAPGEAGWDVVLTGTALLVVHLGSAFTAQLPSYVRVGKVALRRWVLPATIAAMLGPVVALAAELIRGAALPGSLALTVAALAAITGAVWFAAGQSVTDRTNH